MPIRDIIVVGCGTLGSAWVSSAIRTAIMIAQPIVRLVLLPHEQFEDDNCQSKAPSGRRLVTPSRFRVGGALGKGLS